MHFKEFKDLEETLAKLPTIFDIWNKAWENVCVKEKCVCGTVRDRGDRNRK